MTRDEDVDDALMAALEREDERRAEEPDAHELYTAWVGDRAERAMALMSDEEVQRVRLDFRGLRPRGEGEGEARPDEEEGPDGVAPDQVIVDEKHGEVEGEVLRRYALTGEMDAADLLALDLKPARIVVPDLIAVGTTVLASLPKLGKSWMCVQLSVECALGGEFLGRKVEQGDVLYLPLEDGKERTQRRLKKVLAGRTVPRGSLTIRWDSPPLGEGMEAMISEWLDAHPRASMILVDTLGRVRTPGDGRRNAYQVDVQDVGRIQSLVRDRDVALILVHHTKKGKEDDFVSQVSGTLGIAGSADTVLIVNRKRLVELATIEVTSREMVEDSIGVRFVDALWEAAPEALAGVSTQRLAVYDAIKLHGPLWPVAIARLLRAERTSIQHLVNSLLEDGLVERVAGGYVLVESESERVH